MTSRTLLGVRLAGYSSVNPMGLMVIKWHKLKSSKVS